MISEHNVKEAFSALEKAREDVYTAEMAEAQAKRTLEDCEWSVLSSGAIDGRNAEERNAQVAMAVAGERDAHYIMKDASALAELKLEQAKDRVRCLELLAALLVET